MHTIQFKLACGACYSRRQRGFLLNTARISLYSSKSVNSLSNESRDKEFSLSVNIVSLVPVFIWLTAEKCLSTVHVIMGNVRRACRRLYMLGKISQGHASSTSTNVSFFLVCGLFGLCLSFKLLHKHSVLCVFHRNGKVRAGGLDESLVTKSVWPWQAGSSSSHKATCVGLETSVQLYHLLVQYIIP